jgi:porin
MAPVEGQAARGAYAGVTAMYAPPELNRFSQYYEARLYGIGLLPSRPRDMVSVVVSRNVFSNYLVDAALQRGQLAHTDNFSITAAYNASVAPGIRVGIGLGYTNNPTPVVYTPETGSALNFLANVVVYW